MIPLLAVDWATVGTVIGILVGITVLAGVVLKNRFTKFVWSRIVAEPITHWTEKTIGTIVDDRAIVVKAEVERVAEIQAEMAKKTAADLAEHRETLNRILTETSVRLTLIEKVIVKELLPNGGGSTVDKLNRLVQRSDEEAAVRAASTTTTRAVRGPERRGAVPVV